ncbi:unnamed protein product, partial [Mesorhabditis belari]|uniref:EGF-like domain-containing protein n=1 Tax=Mesorhabditis belari TaxID=2138241 RepID=A0AAF3FLN2_9BILA
MIFSPFTVIPSGHWFQPTNDSRRMAVSTGKVWVGPLLLILLIALIYIFSLLPHTHHKNSYIYGDEDQVELTNFPVEKQQHRGYEFSQNSLKITLNLKSQSPMCNSRGSAIMHSDGSVNCECLDVHGLPLFSGNRCETHLCLHNGTLADDNNSCHCEGPWMGKHCEYRCHGNISRNGTDAICECQERDYGEYCQLHCSEKNAIWDRRSKMCTCFNGYDAPSCILCLRPECSIAQSQHKKGVVNSRLTLSGLSFCLITIGLLCITARRRRMTATALPGSDETWYRIFQPQAAGRRCRHDFVCGGSWIPRDRALLVGNSNRQPTQARLARNNRSLTPPPSYCSVEHLDGSSGAPPTYEEAVHRGQNIDIEMHLDRIIEDGDRQEIVEDKEQSTTITTTHTDTGKRRVLS